MRKLKILYSTLDTSKNVIRYGDFFKQEKGLIRSLWDQPFFTLVLVFS